MLKEVGRRGATHFRHTVSLGAHNVVARLTERKHGLLLVTAVVPVDLVFNIHN
jgi:hypothetical protein